MRKLPSLTLSHVLYRRGRDWVSMGKTRGIMVDLWYVSVSKWHHACWNNTRIVFLHERWQLWHCFQLTVYFICSTVKESAALVWVRQGHGGGSVVRVRVNTATCLLKQHENSFQARTMTAMTILPAYKLFYFLYRKGIGCASMGMTWVLVVDLLWVTIACRAMISTTWCGRFVMNAMRRQLTPPWLHLYRSTDEPQPWWIDVWKE